jgi:hypothetical protein
MFNGIRITNKENYYQKEKQSERTGKETSCLVV